MSLPFVFQAHRLLNEMSVSVITCPEASTSAVIARQFPLQPFPREKITVFTPSVTNPFEVVPLQDRLYSEAAVSHAEQADCSAAPLPEPCPLVFRLQLMFLFTQ